MKPRACVALLALGLAASGTIAAIGCGDSVPPSEFTEDSGAPGSDGDTFTSDGGGGDAQTADFPPAPILDGDVPPNIADLFGGAQFAAAGGPCLMEPEVGSLFPRNWLRPRFRWIGANAIAGAADGGSDAGASPDASQNIFELRLHADNQPNDLIVYTASSKWTMPRDMWEGLRQHSAGVPITVTVRGATLSGGALSGGASGSSGPLTIAPVDAPGTIVYWTTTSSGPVDNDSGYNPVLKGFRIGDESVADVMRPSQLPPTSTPIRCLGCHSATPDGLYAAVSARHTYSGGDPAAMTQIAIRSVDGKVTAPPFLTAQAQSLLDRNEQELPVFSKAHWATGDRVLVSLLARSGGFEIIWTDLETTSTAEGTGWGIFARTGDANHPALANVSHDGKTIVYVSSADVDTAGTIVQTGQLYTIPYGNRQGGAATALTGTHAASAREFYPAFSPDDKYIVFNRSALVDSTYHDPNAELYVAPAQGGSPTRFVANDPPACSGAKSPPAYNAWAKWSPAVRSAGGKDYYFSVFSSARNYGGKRFGSRLYLAPMVVEGGTITTYSALYLWNQPENEDNHSPAWDEFQIPPIK
jgi:WD40-like Beta Propeller Repeat